MLNCVSRVYYSHTEIELIKIIKLSGLAVCVDRGLFKMIVSFSGRFLLSLTGTDR